jgi:hypothetical protein
VETDAEAAAVDTTTEPSRKDPSDRRATEAVVAAEATRTAVDSNQEAMEEALQAAADSATETAEEPLTEEADQMDTQDSNKLLDKIPSAPESFFRLRLDFNVQMISFDPQQRAVIT